MRSVGKKSTATFSLTHVTGPNVYGRTVAVDAIDPSKPIYFDTEKWHDGRYLREVFDEDDQIIFIPKNRSAKFMTVYPHAVSLPDEIERRYELAVSAMPADDIEAWTFVGDPDLAHLDAEKVDDPVIKREIALYSHQYQAAELEKYNRLIGTNKSTKRSVLTSRYPLMRGYWHHSDIEHVYIYINATYAQLWKDK